ncbi:hypothetical protein [Paracoccus benzoatiresistens]|uniref:Uncharacterized protein n=1 Tax=Paracoccus benzoatiresistens TaxID=2997341 RepID=A0ABT4J9I8_9RHOB|nr:hypothetical protein [Paracoccus sp. EF6]MCZ0963365.1 hypothetical protein [Paracoccus sp. EF6]
MKASGGAIGRQKLFASGADVLDHVIVTAWNGDDPRLLLLGRDQLEGRLRPNGGACGECKPGRPADALERMADAASVGRAGR